MTTLLICCNLILVPLTCKFWDSRRCLCNWPFFLSDKVLTVTFSKKAWIDLTQTSSFGRRLSPSTGSTSTEYLFMMDIALERLFCSCVNNEASSVLVNKSGRMWWLLEPLEWSRHELESCEDTVLFSSESSSSGCLSDRINLSKVVNTCFRKIAQENVVFGGKNKKRMSKTNCSCFTKRNMFDVFCVSQKIFLTRRWLWVKPVEKGYEFTRVKFHKENSSLQK